MLSITKKTYPRIKEYYPEKEVQPIETGKGTVWFKAGFTQGAPTSPILGNLALEFAGLSQVPGLVQYADDGLCLSDEENDPGIANNPRARLAGIHLAEDKPNGYCMRFKFLGIQFDK
jgi:hypothetical protein